MTTEEKHWIRTRDELIDEIEALGFPKELGYEAAKNLGSPKAMRRLIPVEEVGFDTPYVFWHPERPYLKVPKEEEE